MTCNEMDDYSVNHNMDPYAVLGIARTASKDEIKEAYHTLALIYHPYQLNLMCSKCCWQDMIGPVSAICPHY